MKLSKFFLLSVVFLVGCQTFSNTKKLASATIKIYKDNGSASTERYIPAEKVKIKFTYNDLSGTLSNNENVCPSIGDVNLLVIPVHLPGSEEYKTEEVRNDIEKVFFGSTNEADLNYPSVTSFYEESSFNKLHFKGTVTDWFDVEKYTNINDCSLITQGQNGTIITEILRSAVSWCQSSQGIDLKDYDQNQDGSIDAVWLIYDHLDYMSEYEDRLIKNPQDLGEDLNEAFWNFTYWDWQTNPDVDNPTTSAFSWASFDMMYTSYCNRNENDYVDISSFSASKLDSHTFIHETGHLLGLEDYYSSSDSSYHPAGKYTMMDQNVCDLDSYSKMLLGWINPIVVYGTSEITISQANGNDHSVIVIPSNFEEISSNITKAYENGTIDTFSYEFNPFSEYIMIDLYTPDGLNEIDTYGPLLSGYEPGISTTGVRIYHIDSRIFKCKVINYEGGQKLTYESENWDGEYLSSNEAILMPISNNMTESTSFQLDESYDYFDQIRLLEASKINTFSSSGGATNQSVFKEDSSPFDILTFGYQFFNGNYAFNDGNDLPFKIKVQKIKEANDE